MLWFFLVLRPCFYPWARAGGRRGGDSYFKWVCGYGSHCFLPPRGIDSFCKVYPQDNRIFLTADYFDSNTLSSIKPRNVRRSPPPPPPDTFLYYGIPNGNLSLIGASQKHQITKTNKEHIRRKLCTDIGFGLQLVGLFYN